MINFDNKGFTLVELIVVITILTILSTIGIISLQGYSDSAKNATKITDLSIIGRGIEYGITSGKKFNLNNLKNITYAAHPKNITVKVGELDTGIIPGITQNINDPFTGKPYVISTFGNSENSVIYSQVGGILSSEYGDINMKGSDTSFPLYVPVQKIVGNYQPNKIKGISGLIPRHAIENFEEFENTSNYNSGEIIYGASVYNVANNYIFGMDSVPVTQVTGYTDEKTLLYESFENVEVLNIGENGNSNNHPRCFSDTISQQVAFENESTRIDFLKTVICNIDRTQGVNSKSSLHLDWIRDGVGDGQYNYITLDKTKKYELSFDVKGNMSSALNVNFYCIGFEEDGKRNYIGSKGFSFNVNPNQFERVKAYVNKDDSSGNGLSLYIQNDTNPANINYSCIFYRTGDPRAGEELFFDNFIVKEVN